MSTTPRRFWSRIMKPTARFEVAFGEEAAGAPCASPMRSSRTVVSALTRWPRRTWTLRRSSPRVKVSRPVFRPT